jgi:Tol biopolymer transport system component
VRGTGQDAGSESLVWVDRNGREEPVGLPSRNFDIPRVSRDGRRIGVGICDRSVCDIWVSDVGRPVLSRITSTPESDFFPLWTPDGNRILFTQRGSQVGLAWALADGTGVPEPLLTVDGASLVSAEGWSADGEELVLTYATTPDPRIGVLSMTPDSDGERAFRPLLDRATDASGVAMSPDGAWIAYQSDSSGAYAVYIERYPELGNRQVVSTEPGGWAPLWSHDGRELYYRRLGDGAMMAVSIETSPSLSIGTPEVLFENQGYAPLTTPRPNSGASRPWDVAPDGRFLMIKAFSDAGPREIIIVENWLEEVKRLAPTE